MRKDINKANNNRFNISVVAVFIGCIILAGFAGKLFVLTLIEAYRNMIIWGVLLSIVLLGLIQQYIFIIATSFKERIKAVIWSKNSLFILISVCIGALFTFTLSNDLSMGAVVAAGLTGIIGAILLPKLAIPIYCGAFVGMVSQMCLQNYAHVLIAAIIAGIVFVICLPVFNGFGGKLGAIAYSGCFIATLLTGNQLKSAPIPEWDIACLLIVYSIIGAVVTFFISVRLKHGPVMASGVVGLTGGLLLPAIHSETGNLLAIMIMCASFVGMSSKEKLSNELLVALAGFFAGLVFVFSSPHMDGVGGKLGTIAFGSTIAVNGILHIISYLKVKRLFGFRTKKQAF